MTIAICFACGVIKFGALCPCEKCAATPKSEDEIAVSLLLCDHHMSVPDLEALSEAAVSGEIHPVPDEQSMKLLRPAARDGPTRARHPAEIKKARQQYDRRAKSRRSALRVEVGATHHKANCDSVRTFLGPDVPSPVGFQVDGSVTAADGAPLWQKTEGGRRLTQGKVGTSFILRPRSDFGWR